MSSSEWNEQVVSWLFLTACYYIFIIQGVPYEIDDDLEIFLSPGVSHSSVALMVSRSNLGTVAVASNDVNLAYFRSLLKNVFS